MSSVVPERTCTEFPLENHVRCCASCGSTAVIKSGHNSCGTQQFLCKDCGAHRVLHAKSRTTEPELKARVLHAVEVERISLREAERRFRIARQTIARWRKNGGLASSRRPGSSLSSERGYPNQGNPMFMPSAVRASDTRM